MGEIDHAHNAVDHGIADGDEPVDHTKGHAINQLLDEIFHLLEIIPPCRSRSV